MIWLIVTNELDSASCSLAKERLAAKNMNPYKQKVHLAFFRKKNAAVN